MWFLVWEISVFVTEHLIATFLVLLGLLSQNPKYQDNTLVNSLFNTDCNPASNPSKSFYLFTPK